MDSFRFDQLSKRVAAGRLHRRGAIRGLAAAATAATLFGLRHRTAAADCANLTTCYGRACPPENTGYCEQLILAPIPGGPVGMCWSWSDFTCNPCSTTMAELTARCNQIPGCNGQCKPSAGPF